jgi:two-component system CheB/CheR fusion protein
LSATDETRQFEHLLEHLKHSRGFDFTGYKRSSLIRRVQKRMQSIGVESYSDYMDVLQVRPEEFAQLFNTILINVTAFFRDMPVWEYLAKEVLPLIVANKQPTDTIRVWVAGCSSGEEAYTVAIMMVEAIGLQRFREYVKIYATDVDEEALNLARTACYNSKAVQSISPDLLKKYFEPVNDHYVFDKELRRAVIFGRHDLVQDAPISRIDLLICRNTLMYFNADAQSRILSKFNFALNHDGFLFLGKSEMLLTHGALFMTSDVKRRVFTKVQKGNLRARPHLNSSNGEDNASQAANHVRLREATADTGLIPQVVIDLQGGLAFANQQARALFGLVPRDVGRPMQDLEFSYRPIEMRSQIEQAYADRHAVGIKDVEWLTGGEVRYFDIQLTPLYASNGTAQGVSITFAETTQSKRLQRELQNARQELATAHEELQSTVEELETTNEELQSINEELETTNEELQSTNEEFETMNEELQSTNEELETINEELRQRTGELNLANAFLESILTNLRIGVVVVDQNFCVRAWNLRSEDLWGLRPEEVVGKHFLSLDIGLPVEQLKTPIRRCLTRESEYEEITVEAINRRGRAIECRITCTPLKEETTPSRSVILLIDGQEGGKTG